ncbi:H-type lectin domain-containing protein [Thioclava sp. GXIMD4216]|uniref:H-type lectin domain-containing protein n=1 Tax=unclassified Thioclava TaxID=2621713 RepID=UPI0030D22C57
MLKIDAQQVGIGQGTLVLFSDYQDGGKMWTGTGPRELRRVVNFDEAYAMPPKVQVTLSMWDIDQQHNPRMDISADMITTEGFVIVFRTWGDSKVARVRADWLAIGPVRHDDDWDVY